VAAAKPDGDYDAIKARLDELEVLATDDEEDTDEELQAWTTETESLRAKISKFGDRGKAAELDASAVALLAILKKAREDKAAGIAKIRRVGYAKGVRDDLKDILGVGPVLEKTLNSIDVYTFKEIAGWNDARIDEVSTHLVSFPDRIRREDWVGQCKDLHKKNYGESA
jgi:predicted flap endonuclease-1-like 5' DNA nuclease